MTLSRVSWRIQSKIVGKGCLRHFSMVKIPGVNYSPSRAAAQAALDYSVVENAASTTSTGFSTADPIPSTQIKNIAGYALGKTLGWGRFGIIRDVTLLPNGRIPRFPLAMKLMSTTVHPKVCANETKVYSLLMNGDQSLNLSRFFTVPVEILRHFDPKSNSATLCIVFERMDGSDLFEMITSEGAISEESSKRIVSKLILGIEKLHSLGIVHRDIKPENILFRTNENKELLLDEPVLTDFGLSYCLRSDDLVNRPAGTFGYASPEILSAGLLPKSNGLIWASDFDSNSKEIDSLRLKSDVWSLGVLLYACVSGELPFPATMSGETTIEEHLEAAIAGPKFDHPRWAAASPMCIDIVKKMLHYQPEFRPSIDQLLAHPWLRI